MLRIALLLVLAASPSPHPRQEAGAAPGGQDSYQLPGTPGEAADVELERLEEALAGRSADELARMLESWMLLIEEQQAAVERAVDAPEGSEEREALAVLGADRDALIARAELLVQALADGGGDVAGARARIEEIRGAEARELDRLSTVPADQREAQDLDLEVLRARLRPLTQAQAEEQLSLWLDLLQRKCLEVRRVEVAALESEDAGQIAEFNQRAVGLRGERGRLIERVRTVADALERKGGDTREALAYVDSVVVTPPITGWRAASSTLRTWLVNPDGGLALAQRLGTALAILVAAWLLSRLVGGVIARALYAVKRISELLREFLIGSVRKTILFLGLLIAVSRLGVDMGPMLAAIGAAGLVIGLALQGTLSNFASGLMIMIYRPFDVGDVVSIAGTLGKVKGMSLVTTLITTFDNRTVYIPNNKVWGDVITNLTDNPTRRVDLVVGISYGDDMQRACEVIREVVLAHEQVLEEPAPVVRVNELGESSVNLVVRPWTRTEDYWNVYWDLTQRIKERLDREGITIPFPQRDVHLHGSAGEPERWIAPREKAGEERPSPESASSR